MSHVPDHTYSVEFRIEGYEVVPATVTAQMRLHPTYTREVGEPCGKSRKYEKGLWSYEVVDIASNTPRRWHSLEEGLLHVIERLQPAHSLIRAYSEKFDVYWWCGHFQSSFDGGPQFSPVLLRKLADFGIPLLLENYFSDSAPDGELT
jgi:hypothetical protein